MLKKIKNNKIYIINILIAIAIFLITLIIKQVSPFGDNILGKSDAIAQYKPMLYHYIMSIKTGTWETYTFLNGFGAPFMFNFTYYLISPINFVGLLFNNGDLMYLSVILVKIALTAIFTTFYTKKHGGSDLTATIASISYIFSSWFLAYYYNIMWLDLFMVFPLFQYYLEKLVSEHKVIGFIFSFAYLYVSNFYQAFAILIYGIVYFIIRNFFYEDKNIKEKIKGLFTFIFASLTTISLIFAYLYILVQVKRQTGLGYSDITQAGYFTSTLDFIKSLFYGTTNITTQFEGATYANIAMNTLMLINLFYFFVNKKITIKDKIFALISLNLIIGCIFFKKFDFIMNMFHNVVGLTFRYSFIFVFLGIIPFIKNSKTLENKRDNKIFYIIGLLLILLLVNIKNMELNILIFNIVFILSFAVLAYFYNNGKAYKYLVILVISIQSIIGCYTSITMEGTKEPAKYNSFQTETTTYRTINNDKDVFLNSNMYTNEKSVSQFSSMIYQPASTLTKKLGCQTGGNSITCYSGNELFNMLFNVKNDKQLEKIYAVNKDILKTTLDEHSVKNSYEILVKDMTGIDNIYDKNILKGKIVNNKNSFETTKPYYFIDVNNGYETINILSTDTKFTSENKNEKEVTIYTYKIDKLEKIYKELSKNQIKYTSYKDSHIEGTINVDKDQVIFTSIPYDETWIIKIDGKQIKPTKILDSLIAIEVKPGKHTISMEYVPNYTKAALVSVTTFVLLIGSIIFKKLKKND